MRRRPSPKAGTVLMEAVLCLPLLLLLITGIFQFARIWEARLFTLAAAHSAARAALVLNPADYLDYGNGKALFASHDTPVWAAAADVLAWVDATVPSAASPDWGFPGLGEAKNSAGLRANVTIDPSLSWESNGLVCVAVRFDLPLLYKIYDTDPPAATASPDGTALSALSSESFRLTERCILPKPWSTARHPRLGAVERSRLQRP